jgi:hypothetical protein
MGKKRQAKKQNKKERKNGLNPITGKPMTKKESKQGRRFGFNEDGTTNSKKQNIQDRKMANKDRMQTKADGKADGKRNRTGGRAAKKAGKGAKKASEGRATEELASQGIDSQTNQKKARGENIKNITDTVGDIAGDLLGGDNEEFNDDFNDSYKSASFRKPSKDKADGSTMTILPLALGAMGILYLILNKN